MLRNIGGLSHVKNRVKLLASTALAMATIGGGGAQAQTTTVVNRGRGGKGLLVTGKVWEGENQPAQRSTYRNATTRRRVLRLRAI